MARIHIDLPQSFVFATEMAVYVNHLNYGNHLDNAALLALVSEARVRFLKSFGYSEMDVEGVGLLVTDAAVQYRSEAFHGDVLRFDMAATDFNKYGLDFVYRMVEKTSGREVARGKTGVIFFDHALRRPAGVPAAFRAKVAAASTHRTV